MRRDWICREPFKAPVCVAVVQHLQVPCCLVGCLTGSYQQMGRVGSSGRPFDTAIVHKDSVSVKCARGTCFQGLLSWAIRSGQCVCGFTGVITPCQVSAFCFLPLGESAGFSGFLEAGYRDHHLDFEPKESCSRLQWENGC